MIYIESPGPYTVYKHIAPNGMSYIGVTDREPAKRYGENGEGYRNNELFYADIQKFGWDNFTHLVLYEHKSEKYAYMKEFLLTYQENTVWPNGYNLQGGGKRGYRRSQYVREKISAANRKPIKQIDPLTGEVLAIWPGVRQVAKELGINAGHISEATRHKRRHTAGGFSWEYVEEN